MRTIIAGSRDCVVPLYLHNAIAKCGWVPSVVLCGCARGVDQLGYEWAIDHDIPVELWKAEWDNYGKAAGMIRNKQMAENAQALIAIWDGYSKGTANMIDIAKRMKLKVYVELC